MRSTRFYPESKIVREIEHDVILTAFFNLVKYFFRFFITFFEEFLH
jgi:hypothetical protein